ncbi:MAG: biotin synthase BioB [Bacteroidales bacterium]|nr:biotin synthase BioB [Bacteroidales bacterium]
MKIEKVREIYNKPLLKLVYEAATVHRRFHDSGKIKISTLISVKTGECIEDCAYCAQSVHYDTGIKPQEILTVAEVVEKAIKAKESGATRVCLSTSWRNAEGDENIENIIEMAEGVRKLGMDVCCTLGMINKENVAKLLKAGITGYNHNLDTSRNFYPEIITTRTYDDRLETINNLIDAGMPYCSGGIIGMGESNEDRISLLHTVASQKKHPFNFPVNALVPVKGTPLENQPLVSVWEIVRIIAAARILMPETNISLAAGRINMTEEAQALCFLAGANSVFIGEKLLTTANTKIEDDVRLFEVLGLKDRA